MKAIVLFEKPITLAFQKIFFLISVLQRVLNYIQKNADYSPKIVVLPEVSFKNDSKMPNTVLNYDSMYSRPILKV